MGGLADMLEPDSGQDFAFAPTVHVADIDEPIPPSGPMIVRDPERGAHCMTPLAFPLPPPSEDASLATQARGAFARFRHGWRRQIEDLAELWHGTADEAAAGGPPIVVLLRRVRAVWSCWQWDRADVERAAVIGMSVFVIVATIGASVAAASASDSDDLRVRAPRTPRTVEQHTGRAGALHAKR